MRFKSSLIVLGVVAAVSGVSQAAPVRKIVPKGAVSFTSKAAGFSIWLPVKPVQNRQVVHLKNGETGTVFTFEANKKSINYVIVAANTAGVSKAARGDLDKMQKGFMQSSGATLKKREEIQLSGFRGRELRVITFMGRPARSRMVMTPQFFYQIIAQGEKASMQKQRVQIDKVFDSFRILPH